MGRVYLIGGLWGENITPYSVIWNEKEYVNYCDGIANKRDIKYFTQERVLVREITNPEIYAGYQMINIIAAKGNRILLRVLLAILNSKLATFFHFNSSPKATKY